MNSRAGLACVLTTIQQPTASVRRLAQAVGREGATLIVIGDRKGPASYECPATEFLPIAQQQSLGFEITPLLPENHYVRKNLGYLKAMQSGAQCIYETDDDNMPLPSWAPRELVASLEPIEARSWANIYRLFSPDDLIWPRGFPLNLVSDETTFSHASVGSLLAIEAPIQQGLADGSPDVDAAWRLLLDREYSFPERPGFWLPPNTWCPFNSQSTWWWPVAYPLMYLPVNCTFRMTDIWRSLVAQRCLWALGCGMAFHGSEVLQERNIHNLMRDFKDEVPGYLQNERIAGILSETELEPGDEAVSRNMRTCYSALVEAAIMPKAELPPVDAWLADVGRAKGV